MTTGRVISLHVAPAAAAPMTSTDSVRAVAGRGLEGDRYFLRTGTFSRAEADDHEITLIEMEAIEALVRDYGVPFEAQGARRNVATRGAALNHLVGQAFRVAPEVAIADRVALVVQLLAADESDLRLRLRAPEVERERHASHAAGRNGAGPFVDLAPMKEKLALALGRVVRPGSGAVRRNVRSDEKCLTGAEPHVRVLQLSAPVPQGLHLGSGKDEACLGPVLDEVVVEGLPVRRHRLDSVGRFRWMRLPQFQSS